MKEDDTINELEELFKDTDEKIEDKVEDVDTEKEHPIGENDWVERRKNPAGRRKEDKDRLLATKILLAMTIIMIIVTAGILGIELQIKKELEESIQDSSYEYSVKRYEINKKHQDMQDANKEDENETKESAEEKNENNEDPENKEENIIENIIENVLESAENVIEE